MDRQRLEDIARRHGVELILDYQLLTETDPRSAHRLRLSFVQLASLGVYDTAFGRRIAAFSGLRNRIVHEYDEIDPQKVHKALSTAVEDVVTYLKALEDFVKRMLGD